MCFYHTVAGTVVLLHAVASLLICAAGTGDGDVPVNPATLEAINTVLGVLLAASAKQSTSEPSSSAPSPSTTASSTAEMVGRGAAEQSYRQPSSVQRGSAERQPSSEPAPESSKKSFLKVIDHQYQPASGSMDFSRQLAPGRQDELFSTDYQRGRTLDDTRRIDPVDLQRRLDDDRFGSRLADERRLVGDARDPGRYYSGARRGSEFWNEMSAYCAEYEARVSGTDVGRSQPLRPPADYLDRRRALAAADYSDELYRRRVRESAMSDRVAAEEMERRYRLPPDNWREADLRRARLDDYARQWPGPREADYEAAAALRAPSSALDSRDYYKPSADPSSRR